MSQATQTANVKTGNAIASFLAAIKGGTKGEGATGGLFSELLSETKDSLPRAKTAQLAEGSREDRTKKAFSRSEPNGNVKEKAAPIARKDAKQEKPEVCESRSDTQEESTAESANETQAAREENVEGLSKKDAACEEKALKRIATKTEEAAVPQENEEIAQEGVEEEDCARAFLSLVSPAKEKEDAQEDSEIDAFHEEENEESDPVENLLALAEGEARALMQARKKEDSAARDAEKADSGIGDDIKKTIEDALALKARARSGAQEEAEESAMTSGDAGEDVFDLLQLGGRASRGSSLVDDAGAGAPFEPETVFSARAEGGRALAQNAAFGVAQASGASSSAAPAVEAAKAQALSVGETSSASFSGAGVRSSDMYAFTGQLSAARMTRGGATGLPHAVEQIALQINKMAKDGNDEMTISLRPPELGKVQIKLEFSTDNKVQATIMADNQSALDLLMKDQGSLSRALTEAGLQVGEGSLQFSLNENGQDKSLDQGPAEKNAGALPRFGQEDDETAMAALAETYYMMPGRVNIRV